MFLEHQRNKMNDEILNTKLTTGISFLEGMYLLTALERLQLMDADKNGSVSEQEYVEAMLVILGKVLSLLPFFLQSGPPLLRGLPM
jgi:hypothetical protein